MKSTGGLLAARRDHDGGINLLALVKKFDGDGHPRLRASRGRRKWTKLCLTIMRFKSKTGCRRSQ